MRICTLVVAGLMIIWQLCWRVQAQDPVFSQFFSNKMYLNPALTGYEMGAALTVNYRDQWRRIRKGYSRFTTQSVGMSMSAPCLRASFGVLYVDNVEGEGFLRWQSISGAYAYSVLLNKNNRNYPVEITAGLRLSYNYRSVNWNNLVFSDQLDAIYGVVGASQLVPPASVSRTDGYFDADAGAMFLHDRLRVGGALFEEFRVGLAVSHLVPSTNTSLLGYNERLPMRWTLHLSWINQWKYGSTGDNRHSISIAPLLKAEFQDASHLQGAFTYMTWNYGAAISAMGLYGGAYLQTRKVFPDLQNTTSLIGMMGAEWESNQWRYRLGISKDFNVTGVANEGGGAWEVSLLINPQFVMLCNPTSPVMRRKRVSRCPAL